MAGFEAPSETTQGAIFDHHRFPRRSRGLARRRLRVSGWNVTSVVESERLCVAERALLPGLLLALSTRYRTLCFTSAWEDPNLFKAGSSLILRGRLKRRTTRPLDARRLRKVILRQAAVPLNGSGGDESAADNDFISRCWITLNANARGARTASARRVQAPLTREEGWKHPTSVDPADGRLAMAAFQMTVRAMSRHLTDSCAQSAPRPTQVRG